MSLQAAVLTNSPINIALTSARTGLLDNDALLLLMAINRNHHQCTDLIRLVCKTSISSLLLNKCIIVAITSLNYGAVTTLYEYQSLTEREKQLDDYLKAAIVSDNSPVLQGLVRQFRLKVVARAGTLLTLAIEHDARFCLEELFTFRRYVDLKSVELALDHLLLRESPDAISLINTINAEDLGAVAVKCLEAGNNKLFRYTISQGIPSSAIAKLFSLAIKRDAAIFVEDLIAVFPEVRDVSKILLQQMAASNDYMNEAMVLAVVDAPSFDKRLGYRYLVAALQQEMLVVVSHLLADPWLSLDRKILEPIIAVRANSPAALLVQGDSRWSDGVNSVPLKQLGDLRPATSNGKGWIITGYDAAGRCWIEVERCVENVIVPYHLRVSEHVEPRTYTSMKITETSITLDGPNSRTLIPSSPLLALRAVAVPVDVIAAFKAIEKEGGRAITFKKYPILRCLRITNVVANLRRIFGDNTIVDYDDDAGYTIRS